MTEEAKYYLNNELKFAINGVLLNKEAQFNDSAHNRSLLKRSLSAAELMNYFI